MYLARNLQLSIEKQADLFSDNGDLIRIRLSDPRTSEDISIDYSYGYNTADRDYHTREAIVIALRCVVSKACQEGLIRISSSSPGVSVDLSGI